MIYKLNNLEEMNLKLNSLVIFKKLLNDKVIKKLSKMLSISDKSLLERVSSYSSFASELFLETVNLTDYILNLVFEDENLYVLKYIKNDVDAKLEKNLEDEINILEKISRLTSIEVKNNIDYNGYLPEWENENLNFLSLYRQRIKNITTFGYGIYSKYHMFTVKDGNISPVRWPDQITISNLEGYEEERKAIVDNTISLLKGKPAANVLLYGDAGTGKSSTVKAVANEFKDKGLRLIEITKEQFGEIPGIIEELTQNPLKFILFIDDLSFERDSDDFNALKAALEGSVFSKTPNILIYATSNRRHLVKESFSDRSGDDIHVNETIQELCSLSDRFGLLVSFFKPNKELYLKIVHGLKMQYGIKMNDAKLDFEAEKYALNRGGRSPRAARQFIEYIKSTEDD
ncbi:MAG: ATP-binding protein [Eubacteriales bacterium]